jgi:hypothetical protein
MACQTLHRGDFVRMFLFGMILTECDQKVLYRSNLLDFYESLIR